MTIILISYKTKCIILAHSFFFFFFFISILKISDDIIQLKNNVLINALFKELELKCHKVSKRFKVVNIIQILLQLENVRLILFHRKRILHRKLLKTYEQ